MFLTRTMPTGKRTLWLFIGLTLFCGCTSRYRLNLYMTGEGHTKKVKVEKTEFIPYAVLSDPYADEKIVAGAANVATITTGTRWQRPEDKRVFMFGFDEYLKCLIYIQFPQALSPDTIDLSGNSFVHLLGRYDLPAESKIFLPASGTAVIDSVTSKHLFVSLHSRYENKSGKPLAFEGQLKVRMFR